MAHGGIGNQNAKGHGSPPIHGHSPAGNRSKTYNTWRGIRDRCGKTPRYEDVKCCDRWKKFENFLKDMGERPEGTSIDRINPFGNYEPDNCRWADSVTQSNNTRRNYGYKRNAKRRRSYKGRPRHAKQGSHGGKHSAKGKDKTVRGGTS